MVKKFDVVIGNPPYQKESAGGNARKPPIYHLFMDAAYEVGHKAVLITPSRFLFNAGQTPKEWNRKMLSDPRLRVAHYVADGNEVFPDASVKGGVAVTVWDENRTGPAIGLFTPEEKLAEILAKVKVKGERSLKSEVSSTSSYRYTQKLHDDHPEISKILSSNAQFKVNTNAFDQLNFLFYDVPPEDGYEYVQVHGLIRNVRHVKYFRKDYISEPRDFSKWKVALPSASKAGVFGETLSSPMILGPRIAVTQSLITIGAFDSESEVNAAFKYIKTKFLRTMLFILKTTQHNPPSVWEHVPVQNFSQKSEIDWSESVAEIDQQLYRKYGLNDEEIAFIEDRVQPMI